MLATKRIATNYNTYCIKEAAKRNYFENVFSGACNPSEACENINQIVRKSQLNTTKIPNAVKVDKKIITAPTQICNTINEYFVTDGVKQGFKTNAPKTQKLP